MPIITVLIYSGRTQREKDRLAEAMTEDIAKILNIKKEGIYYFKKHPTEIGIPQEFVYNITTFVT